MDLHLIIFYNVLLKWFLIVIQIKATDVRFALYLKMLLIMKIANFSVDAPKTIFSDVAFKIFFYNL